MLLYHAITCSEDGRCDPPRTESYDVMRAGKVVRTVFVDLPGCAVDAEWRREYALCEVADEIMEPIETMIREVLVDDRWIPEARNDAAMAIVRGLVASGRMPHPLGQSA